MTIKTGPNVSDHYSMEDRPRYGCDGPRVLKQFLLDAAIDAMRTAMQGAEDILDFDFVDCSGNYEGDPWQAVAVRFYYETGDGETVERKVSLRLSLADEDE